MLPIVPAFNVVAMIVPVNVALAPIWVAPVLPIVPACTVDAITVPLLVTAPTVKLVNVPTLVKLLAVTPLANVDPDNVPAGATTAAVVSAETRPYASVVTTGIAVELPADMAPGPVDGNANVTAPVDAETVMLPVPELDNPVTPLLVIVTAVVEPVVV